MAYRLVSSLRFNPSASATRYRLRAGNARVKRRKLRLLVRNAGNTVEPVSGRVSISGGSGGRSAAIASTPILPGKLVSLRVASLRGLRRGSYNARITLNQAGRQRLTVSKRFRIGR